MRDRFRVFGRNEARLEPAAIMQLVRARAIPCSGKFRGDDQGWFSAEFVWEDQTPFLRLECYLAVEEGLRGELNTWVAWLESEDYNSAQEWLMDHMIHAKQFFTLEPLAGQARGAAVAELCVELCQLLARETDGIYQVDGQGLFAPDGALLQAE